MSDTDVIAFNEQTYLLTSDLVLQHAGPGAFFVGDPQPMIRV